jgi:hypothetical protein
MGANLPSKEAVFLDLQISITVAGTITTKTYQKPMNLYLYRPPTPAQPDSILYSLIYGTLHRYYWQNSNIRDFEQYTKLFFSRLLARGHNLMHIEPLFRMAAAAVETSSLPNPRPGAPATNETSMNGVLFIHSPFHPQFPSRRDIKKHVTPLMKGAETAKKRFERIIIAFSRAPNIGDLCKKNRLEETLDTHTR